MKVEDFSRDEIIRKPLEFVDGIFDQKRELGLGKECEWFKSKLNLHNGAWDVPYLSSEDLNEKNVLRRWVCMIQDMLEPELYLAEATTPDGRCQTLHFRECVGRDGQWHFTEKIESRQVVVGTSIPYETDWCLQNKNKMKLVCKLYEEGFCLNQVVEMVAVVSELYGEEPMKACLHVVHFRPFYYYNPIINPSLLGEGDCMPLHQLLPALNETLPSSHSCSIQDLRAVVLQMLEAVLCDAVAAQYVLFTIISRDFTKVQEAPVGRISLSIEANTRSPAQFVQNVEACLSTILPRVLTFSLTLQNLNAEKLVPHRKCAADKLSEGAFQMAPGTVVIVDETQLCEGKLSPLGTHNLLELGKLVKHEPLDYDFECYTLPFHCSATSIVISQGPSIVKDGCIRVPLCPSKQLEDATFESIENCLLPAVRTYVGALWSQNIAGDISDLEKIVENSWMEQRKIDDTLDATDLHLWMNLVRALCFSLGEMKATAQHWEAVQELEKIRKQRLKIDAAARKKKHTHIPQKE